MKLDAEEVMDSAERLGKADGEGAGELNREHAGKFGRVQHLRTRIALAGGGPRRGEAEQSLSADRPRRRQAALRAAGHRPGPCAGALHLTEGGPHGQARRRGRVGQRRRQSAAHHGPADPAAVAGSGVRHAARRAVVRGHAYAGCARAHRRQGDDDDRTAPFGCCRVELRRPGSTPGSAPSTATSNASAAVASAATAPAATAAAATSPTAGGGRDTHTPSPTARPTATAADGAVTGAAAGAEVGGKVIGGGYGRQVGSAIGGVLGALGGAAERRTSRRAGLPTLSHFKRTTSCDGDWRLARRVHFRCGSHHRHAMDEGGRTRYRAVIRSYQPRGSCRGGSSKPWAPRARPSPARSASGTGIGLFQSVLGLDPGGRGESMEEHRRGGQPMPKARPASDTEPRVRVDGFRVRASPCMATSKFREVRGEVTHQHAGPADRQPRLLPRQGRSGRRRRGVPGQRRQRAMANAAFTAGYSVNLSAKGQAKASVNDQASDVAH